MLGDYLLARNMELGMRSGQYDLVSYVIASIATLCEGELLQSDRADRMEITRDAYLEIIYKKTASLLGISAGVGALSAGAGRERVDRMRRFGDALGMAFQIQDDILDFTRGAATGKPSNNDLREHKITLPLLVLLDRADAARRAELLELLARCHEDETAVDALQRAVEEHGGLREASETMHGYLQRAAALLAEWPTRRSARRWSTSAPTWPNATDERRKPIRNTYGKTEKNLCSAHCDDVRAVLHDLVRDRTSEPDGHHRPEPVRRLELHVAARATPPTSSPTPSWGCRRA